MSVISGCFWDVANKADKQWIGIPICTLKDSVSLDDFCNTHGLEITECEENNNFVSRGAGFVSEDSGSHYYVYTEVPPKGIGPESEVRICSYSPLTSTDSELGERVAYAYQDVCHACSLTDEVDWVSPYASGQSGEPVGRPEHSVNT